MKTRYQYIHFVETGSGPKTSAWECISNSRDRVLGVVKWYGGWRQYCFFPEPKTLYNWICLGDIERFLKQLNLEHQMQNAPTGSLTGRKLNNQ